MAAFDWNTFLREWSEAILSSDSARELPPDVRNSRWLGFPPATDEQIAAVEKKLKIPLPPSYRAFLKITNGWRRMPHEIDRLRPVGEVAWFRKENRDWIDAYSVGASMYGPREESPDEEYFSYDIERGGGAADFREAHLKETLQISDSVDGGVFLLNPQVIDADGEWEAWFFGNWVPGAIRYRSFAEMMRVAYAASIGDYEGKPTPRRADEPMPDEYIGAPGSAKRRLKPRQKPGPPVERLLAALEDEQLARQLFPKAAKLTAMAMMSMPALTPAVSVRCRVIEELGRSRDRRAVEPLLAILATEENWNIRQAIASAFGQLGDERTIEPLLEMLDDDSNAACAALDSLKQIAPDRLREPLLEQLNKRSMFTFLLGGMLLAEMNETRAIPILCGFIDNAAGPQDRAAMDACMILADWPGGAGVAELAAVARSNSPVRHMAASMLARPKDHEAVAAIYRELLNDPDPAMRKTAEEGLKFVDFMRGQTPKKRDE